MISRGSILLLAFSLIGCSTAPEWTRSQKRDRAFAHLAQGLDDQFRGRLEAAEGRYRLAAKLVPESPTIHKRLADALYLLGQKEQAVGYLRQAVVLTDPADTEMLLGLMSLAADNGQSAVALELAGRLAGGDDHGALEASARVYAGAGHWKRVREVFAILVANLDREARSRRLIWLGGLLHHSGRFGEAAEVYREALELPEPPARLPLDIARCEARAGRHAEALGSLDRYARQQGGLRAREALFRAKLLFLAGRVRDAETILGGLIESGREELDARMLWARQLARMAPRRALAMLDPIERRGHPEVLRYYLLRGQVEYRMGQKEAARKSWRRGARRFPESSLPMMHLAGSWQVEGELKKAREAYEVALLRQPTNGLVLHALGSFHLDATGEADLAVRYLEQALRETASISIGIDLARALLRSGRADRSLRLLGDLLGKRQDPRVWRALGVALLAVGDPNGAIRAWERGIRLDPDAFLAARIKDLRAKTACNESVKN